MSQQACPLCLEPVLPDAAIHLRCATCKASLEIRGTGGPAFQHKPGCSHAGVVFGVWACHEGCSASNPLADDAPDTPYSVVLQDGTSAKVDHQLLRILWDMASKRKPEMWAPVRMWDAFNAEPEDPRSCVVALIGARQVGKTTLATLALDPESHGPTRWQGSESFIYVQNHEEFLRALLLSKRFQVPGPSFHAIVRQTPRRTPNVRAVFLHDESGAAASTGKSRHLVGVVRRFADKALPPGLARALRSLWPGPGAHDVRRTSDLLIYDSAGEESEGGLTIERYFVQSRASVLAILVDATDLARFRPGTGTSNGSSVATALKVFDQPKWKAAQRRCLIVTKLDCVTQLAGAQPRDFITLLDRTNSIEGQLASRLDRAGGCPLFFMQASQIEAEHNVATIEGFSKWLEWCLGARLGQLLDVR